MDTNTPRVGNWPILIDVYMCPALELNTEYEGARAKAKSRIEKIVKDTIAIDAPVSSLWSGNSVRRDDKEADTWTTLTLGAFFRNATLAELESYAAKISAALDGVNLSMVSDSRAVPNDVEVATPERIEFLRSETANAQAFKTKLASGEYKVEKYVPSEKSPEAPAPSEDKGSVSIPGVADGESTRGMSVRDLF